jgi:hypothetical protein
MTKAPEFAGKGGRGAVTSLDSGFCGLNPKTVASAEWGRNPRIFRELKRYDLQEANNSAFLYCLQTQKMASANLPHSRGWMISVPQRSRAETEPTKQ